MKQSKVSYLNWQPKYKIGDKALYNGETVEIMFPCVNKSYCINEGGKMLLVEEKELEE